mgnify:CR=1 FL=1
MQEREFGEWRSDEPVLPSQLRFVGIELMGDEPDEDEPGDGELGFVSITVDAELTEEQVDLLRERLALACRDHIKLFLQEHGIPSGGTVIEESA